LRIIASSIIVALLFLSLFVFAFTIQPAKAQSGTIVINADGSVSSSTAPIKNVGNVTYTFTGNIINDSIVVERNNIVVDGAGHTIQGMGISLFIGMNLTGRSNVTIKNMKIMDAFGYGVYLYSSSNCTVSGNNITNSGYGIDLWRSSGNVLSGNNVTGNTQGIYLDYSSGNVLSGNVMASNGLNFDVDGNVLSDFVNYIASSNLVNGKPVYYLMNQSNIVISPTTYSKGVGYLGLINCKNVTMQGLTLTKNGKGLLLANTTDSKITYNNVTANSFGIYLYSSSGNVLSGNNVAANINFGIYLIHSCSGNILSGNNVTANSEYGIALIYSSSGNRIFHNNFLNNTYETYVFNSNSTWDDGYPSGGNYWSNYTGVDQKNGLYQNQTGSDGIGDTPYVIGANNTDRYPLMGIFHIYVPSNVTVISNSTITGFCTVINLDTLELSICFNVTGKQGSTGFCRVSIPTTLMGGTYRVFVNGTEIPYTLLPCSNANVSYLYFTYKQSTEQVIIIPEFPSFLILSLFMIITLFGAIILKRKRNEKK
jgi:parallel beta-helix repeat protein